MKLKYKTQKDVCIIDDFIYQFKFPFIASNMYMILEKEQKSALIVDPHKNQEAEQLLTEYDIGKVLVLLTHEHFDHTSGIPWLQNNFECHIYCQESAVQHISQRRNNRPILAYMLNGNNYQTEIKTFFRDYKPYTYQAEKICINKFSFSWGMHEFIMQHAPGHSPASVLIEMDKKYVFTGDSLIPGEPVITRFPGGDKGFFESITLPMLEAIEGNKVILPGHGKPMKKNNLEYDNFIFKVLFDEV